MPSLLETLQLRKPAVARGEAALFSLGLNPQERDQVMALLASAADPDAAIHYFLGLKQHQPDAFGRVVRSSSALKYLITVASFSRFLSEEILQNPQWLEEVSAMSRVLTAGEYKKRLGKFLKDQPEGKPLALSLALFRRQQILRILLRDVLGFNSLSETTE
jgi:glutamine synthetase adenylyltransferase